MAERPMATVLKTVVAQVTVGSNPTPSANAVALAKVGRDCYEYLYIETFARSDNAGEVPEWTIGAAC